jgi:hypothetical protein
MLFVREGYNNRVTLQLASESEVITALVATGPYTFWPSSSSAAPDWTVEQQNFFESMCDKFTTIPN